MTTNTDISTAAATLGRKGGKTITTAKAEAARENGRKGGRPAHLELVCPDPAASTWDEFFRIGRQEVTPQVHRLDQFGAEAVLGGWIYSADQDDMEGYPNPGSYYLTRDRRA